MSSGHADATPPREHFDPLELDDLLTGRQDGVLDALHLGSCRRCREALFDLAVMGALLRATALPHPLDRQESATFDARPPVAAVAASAKVAMVGESNDARILYSRKRERPFHLSADAMNALLDASFAEDAPDPDFLKGVRHLRDCDPCLARLLRVSQGTAPSNRSVAGIVEALSEYKGGKPA